MTKKFPISNFLRHRRTRLSRKLLVTIASLLAVFFLGILINFHKTYGMELNAAQVPTQDPGFTLDPLNIDKQWGLAAAGFPKAWEKTLGSSSTIVAIVDTGIDQNHEDLLKANFVIGFDFISNQPLPLGGNSDNNGHGTLVAGIIGATANNSLGITGSNWNITLMPIKALDEEGRGDSATVAKAIVWAADNKANIINLSFGGSGFDHDADLAKAIAYAFNKGVVLIAAAGNDLADSAKDLDKQPGFPVCNDNDQNMVIGVTAIDQNQIKPDFANYGKNCVDVAAPGKRILSTINIDPLTKKATKSGYSYVSGTSMATAFVSGQAALIKSLYPNATNRQIRDRIISTARSVDNINIGRCGGASCVGRLGAGLINVNESILHDFPLPQVLDGDVVKAEGDNIVYWIYGGQKRLISPFVYDQRFINTPIKIVPAVLLNKIPFGPYATPLEGTLIKTLNSPTVYQISNGLKLPITGQIFAQRQYSFKDVKIVDFVEADSWVTGKFLGPKEGTLVKTPNSPDLYSTISGSFHKISKEYYKNRGLWIFPLITVTVKDFLSYNIGEAYLR